MQMITDFFAALSRIFRSTAKVTVPLELLIEQTANNLSISHAESEIAAIKAKKDLMASSDVTAEEIAEYRKNLWG